MSRGLKITFLVNAIVMLVLGIALYVKPGIWATMVNWRPFDWTITRVFAAALLALAAGSWFAYRAERWEEVRILVQIEIAFTVLSAVANLYGVLVAHGPALTWAALVLWVALAVAFVSFYGPARVGVKGLAGTTGR